MHPAHKTIHTTIGCLSRSSILDAFRNVNSLACDWDFRTNSKALKWVSISKNDGFYTPKMADDQKLNAK